MYSIAYSKNRAGILTYDKLSYIIFFICQIVIYLFYNLNTNIFG